MPQSPNVIALVVAAGRGQRAGGGLPKQYRSVAGRPLLARSLEALASHVAAVLVVIHPDDTPLYRDVLADLDQAVRPKFMEAAHGAATRQGSVLAGLEAIALRPACPDIVLIHDGARPFVSPQLIGRAIESALRHGAAVPGTPVSDTIQEIDAEGRIVATPDRSRLRAVQTPQAFRFDLVLAAHRLAAAAGLDCTDDAAVAAYAGHGVHVFEGDADNMKVTTPVDFARAEQHCGETASEVRVAQGYDVHAFVPGDHVWLGGVRIAHDQRLNGHSDADVVLHALTDAVLGAIGDGDIGVHFPPSDPQWRGASSHLFLEDAVARLRRRGGVLANLDATIVCEAPKIGPHRDAMRQRIAEIAGIEVDQVGIKATTSEGLGFTGRREGIAALALATVRLPHRR